MRDHVPSVANAFALSRTFHVDDMLPLARSRFRWQWERLRIVNRFAQSWKYFARWNVSRVEVRLSLVRIQRIGRRLREAQLLAP
jgi:hypothetical protein